MNMIRNVLAYLERSKDRYPDRVAFEDEATSFTYAALYDRARAIGSDLAAHIAPQTPVVLYMEKRPACIAAMMGAVYAGCFYVPVDPSMPEARVARVFDVLQPACVICDEEQLAKMQAMAPREAYVTTYDQVGAPVDAAALAALRAAAIDTDLLYVLFTSGSTGVPKGVAITHRSVIDFAEWVCDTLAIDATVRFGNQAPLYFDNSILDIYGAMCAGAMVFMIPKRCFLFPKKMMDCLDEHQINTIFWVPSALISVANSGILADRAPKWVSRVFFCGEVMPCRALNQWRAALPDAVYVNMYGPTEITDVCTYYIVDRPFDDADDLPIGHPCANTRVMAIDGELCVTGTCLSPGYYNAPDKTSAAFVPNPLRPQTTEIIYKTGDLARQNERGEWMFLGRKDTQIKRKGYRIELGEIETALRATEGVQNGCCLYDAGTEQIVCFYAGALASTDLARALKLHLPKYMMPDRYIPLDAMPETGNGKIDRVGLRTAYMNHS